MVPNEEAVPPRFLGGESEVELGPHVAKVSEVGHVESKAHVFASRSRSMPQDRMQAMVMQ